jgi:hypothetical protein
LIGSHGEEMRAYLETCLRLPPVPPADQVRPPGRTIDVELVSYSTGLSYHPLDLFGPSDASDGEYRGATLPWLSRPRIRLVGSLHELASGRLLGRVKVVERLRMLDYLGRYWRSFVAPIRRGSLDYHQPLVDAGDMRSLLARSVERLIQRAARVG